MPRGPGRLYEELAMEARRAGWLGGAEVVSVPSLKEVHLVYRGHVFSVKVVERAYRVPPSLLYRYAVSLLRHAKERGQRAYLVLVVPRLTIGSLRLLATRLRWVRVVHLRSARSAARLLLLQLHTLAYNAVRLYKCRECTSLEKTIAKTLHIPYTHRKERKTTVKQRHRKIMGKQYAKQKYI